MCEDVSPRKVWVECCSPGNHATLANYLRHKEASAGVSALHVGKENWAGCEYGITSQQRWLKCKAGMCMFMGSASQFKAFRELSEKYVNVGDTPSSPRPFLPRKY